MNGKRHTPLKEKDLQRMREMRANGAKMQDIADEMQITISAVSKILSGKYVHTTALPCITPEMQETYDFYVYRSSLNRPVNEAEINLYAHRLWEQFITMMEGAANE